MRRGSVRDFSFSIATDGSGDYTATHAEYVVGRVIAIDVTISGLTAGADTTIEFTNTPSGTDKTILTLTDSVTDAHYEVRGLGSTNVGGSTSEYVHPFVMGNPKVTVAQGGVTKTGTVVIYVDEG